MADEEDAQRCSFCGKRESGEALVEGGGEETLGLPLVRICLQCATACVDALETEDRIIEARESTPPESLKIKEKEGLGVVLDWTEFMLDGRKLERRHEALLAMSVNPVSQLSLREHGQTAGVTVDVESNAPIDVEHARAAAKLVSVHEAKQRTNQEMQSNWTSADSSSSSVEWVPFESDDKVWEFAVWKTVRTRVFRCVRVTVRDPETGWTKQMMASGNPVPSVDDAVMAAVFDSPP